MAGKIDRRLNYVIPVERDDGTTVYIHSAPIPETVFEQYFEPMSRAMSRIINLGLGNTFGPRVAALELRKAAKDIGEWEGPDGVENGLMNEIRRLTNVVAPSPPNGWETIPYADARSRNLIDERDIGEIENAIVFFTLASSIYRRKDQPGWLDGAAQLWGALTSSLNCTEYAKSLPTSTTAENTGAKPVGLPVPS